MMFFASLKMMLLPLVAMMRCLPQCAVRHTSFAKRASLGEAVIICRRQTSFKKRTLVGRQRCVFCCVRTIKKIFLPFLRMNSNSRKTMHRLRRYDVFRFAQNDVAPLRSASDAMFAPMCRQAHIVRAANIIRRSRHHLPQANIIQKTHLCR